MNELKNKLNAIKDETNSDLENEVMDYVLNRYNTNEEIECFFNDLSNGGCQSGMISTLIYYVDTEAFFDKYEEEIEDLIKELKQNFGYKTRPEFINSLNGSAEDITQEKNLLSWFAFEETARNIADQIGLDI